MDRDQQIVPYIQQELCDYDDALEPGYRFRPTDAELLVYYLKRKIELGEQPRCRIYDVHVYNHHPNELTERYRSCEGIWYFFTMRERKHPKGTRVNRRTKDFGYWKSTQKGEVYDFVARRVVGKKRSLAYHDEKDRKTEWLMYEYTCNDPNLPNGSHSNETTDWVLCKIYKKASTRNVNHNNQPTDQQVENTSNQGDAIQQQNQLDDEPSPTKRPRVNHPSEQVQHNETDHHLGSMFQTNHQSTGTRSRLSIAMGSGQPMFPTQAFGVGYNHRLGSNTKPTVQPPVAFQDPNQEQVQSYNGSSTCEQTLVNMQSGYNGPMEENATDDDIWDLVDYEELMSLLED
ncbi:putative transcription factor NAM family [Helianthus annuus]|uniref:Putative NAC domain-containing protein n=1 Tax=Helianthus annuus TaxID=4232 RepID=A0A251V2S8_HELAN|nr:putative transcription factor NAM family [Helianthus annuus]KAJ0582644.1 putative transcription factor NAM family [Helianthus annuus]KAJ0598627.1 putative transcription factor NAM family [Helianthus annuus]KAJ0762876.1 putative transcription factor NAM family [Helianthus annuus]